MSKTEDAINMYCDKCGQRLLRDAPTAAAIYTYGKERILEAIHNVGGCDGDSEYDKGWDAAIGEAYRVVEAMEYYLPEWIPVEERLPEGGEVVQVTVRCGWVDVGYYDESREEWWTLDDNGLMDVIAWQPMAEPYRPAGESIPRVNQ